jgi:GGDEF domain-containing protein
MKRTQLYIEDDVFKVLKRISGEKALSVSELVRDAIRKVYTLERPADAEFVLREAAGIWMDRKDIGSTEDYVRKTRKSARSKRWEAG